MIQKKRILFLTRLYHPHIGGVEKHVEELSSVFIKKGYEITIITEKFNKKLPGSDVIKGCKVYRIDIPGNAFLKKFFIWKWMVLHVNIIAQSDILHIHDVFYWYIPFRFLFLFKKTYITFHGYEGFPIKRTWKMQRKLAEVLTNGNICVGEFMKKWYKTRPTSVIYGGVRLEGKKYMSKARTGVFFGRLDGQTGILDYIKAYNLVKRKYPDFVMTVVGEGKLKVRIPKGVNVIGFRKDIYPYIQKNRLIFVSRYLSMLEALASKREVIATYDNAVKRDYLLLSPFKKYIHVGSSASEIADIVITLLGRKTPSKELYMGAKWAQTQTWDKVATTYLSLWNTK